MLRLYAAEYAFVVKSLLLQGSNLWSSIAVKTYGISAAILAVVERTHYHGGNKRDHRCRQFFLLRFLRERGTELVDDLPAEALGGPEVSRSQPINEDRKCERLIARDSVLLMNQIV